MSFLRHDNPLCGGLPEKDRLRLFEEGLKFDMLAALDFFLFLFDSFFWKRAAKFDRDVFSNLSLRQTLR